MAGINKKPGPTKKGGKKMATARCPKCGGNIYIKLSILMCAGCSKPTDKCTCRKKKGK